jgi:hypothetical protein
MPYNCITPLNATFRVRIVHDIENKKLFIDPFSPELSDCAHNANAYYYPEHANG